MPPVNRPQDGRTRDVLRSEIESSRIEFHRILDSTAGDGWHAKSGNAGWTNGELLFHVTFALILLSTLAPLVRIWARLPTRCSWLFACVLNSLTPCFNWVNGLGARGGARLYDRTRIARRYDGACAAALRAIDGTRDDEWGLGMHYPNRWDHLFKSFMTLEDLFKYPSAHLRFHVQQLSA